MAVKTMADYLSEVAADYTTTELSVTPQETLSEIGEKKQIVHTYDDGSISVVSLSDDSFFTVTLLWPVISSADAGTIFDFFHDSAKGNGKERTFYFQHPKDSETYTVRFMSELTRAYHHRLPSNEDVNQVQLRVEGVKPSA